MIHLGIDPGKAGSVAFIKQKVGGKTELTVIPTPVVRQEYDIGDMAAILKIYEPTFGVIERAQTMPGQGSVSGGTFMKGYGIWLGILGALGIPYQIVHSRVWTRVMLAGAPGEGKERAYNVARNLFPEWQPKLKKEYQYADSILLAEYSRRIYQGK